MALAATIGSSIFGFIAISEMLDGNMLHGRCIASLVEGAICPSEAGSFGSIGFHLDFLKIFGMAVIAAALTIIVFVCIDKITHLIFNHRREKLYFSIAGWSLHDSGYFRELFKFITFRRESPNLA